jgi:hypothetical protein
MVHQIHLTERLRRREYTRADEALLFDVFADLNSFERERGKGNATEAARACLDFGFTCTACESICSIVRPSNVFSCAVAAPIHTVRRELIRVLIRREPPALIFFTTRRDWEDRRRS